MKSGLSDEFSDIRKGEMLTIVDSVATLGCEINAVGINPAGQPMQFLVWRQLRPALNVNIQSPLLFDTLIPAFSRRAKKILRGSLNIYL